MIFTHIHFSYFSNIKEILSFFSLKTARSDFQGKDNLLRQQGYYWKNGTFYTYTLSYEIKSILHNL